jgi:geranylgeranylglycerol-phosphate geranylgeranyltransferase
VGHPLGRLALLHPFPSALNALLVVALSTIAGAPAPAAVVLALGMLGFQVSIGALNDLVDAPVDRVAKPAKPIPSGLVAPRTAVVISVGGALAGGVLAGWVAPVAALVGVAGWACGAAYDLGLKRRGLGWLAFAIAFPLLLLYAWTGPTGTLPPGWPTLLPLAMLAGATLQVANALTDLEADRDAGIGGRLTQWPRSTAVRVLALLLAATLGLAWLTMAAVGAGAVPVALATGATVSALVGFAGSTHGTRRSMAWGWSLQAVGVALFAVAWVAAAADAA